MKVFPVSLAAILVVVLSAAMACAGEGTAAPGSAASSRELGISRAVEAVAALLVIEDPAVDTLYIADNTRDYDLLETGTLCGLRVTRGQGFPCVAGISIELEKAKADGTGLYREILVRVGAAEGNQRRFKVAVSQLDPKHEFVLRQISSSDFDEERLTLAEETYSIADGPYPLDTPGVLEACRATIAMLALRREQGSLEAVHLASGFSDQDFVQAARLFSSRIKRGFRSESEFPLLRSCKVLGQQEIGGDTHIAVDVAWFPDRSSVVHFLVVVRWLPQGKRSIESVKIGLVEDIGGVRLD